MESKKVVIYCIKNLLNDRVYVGSTVNPADRKREHFRDLFINKHHSHTLQTDYNKFGKESFVFIELLNNIDLSERFKKEQIYIDKLNSFYNINKDASSRKGRKATHYENLRNSFNNQGEKNSNSKIKDFQVLEILELSKTESVKTISDKYNVHRSTITRILNAKAYKHLGIIKTTKKRIYSVEGKKRLRENGIKNISSTKKAVIDTDTGIRYESITQLANLLNVNYSYLTEKIKNKPDFRYKYAS